MKKLIIIGTAVIALALAGSAAAALVPGTFVAPGAVCSPTSTFSNGVLHLSKPCTTETAASAGAEITGVSGQTFTSASFTLANTTQCQGGSPRFNIFTTTGTFFLGCNTVTPVVNMDGTATYSFVPANAFPGPPTGTVTGVEVLIDVQGTADLSNIIYNGQLQTPVATSPTSVAQCKHGGWKSFTSPSFKNQGQCVSWVQHHVLGHGHGRR